MYCVKCRGEYIGSKRCPLCQLPLVPEQRPEFNPNSENIDYDELMNRIRRASGQLTIPLYTTDIGIEKKWRFPYYGFGYAWMRQMQGACEFVQVDLVLDELIRKRSTRFPFRGYGFAWAESLVGSIGGTPLKLRADRVKREHKWGFPYQGFGRAWAERFSGECGNRITVELVITSVGRHSEYGFPYKGYGFAWENRGELILRIAT